MAHAKKFDILKFFKTVFAVKRMEIFMKHSILLKGTELNVSPIAFGTVRAGLDWDGKDAEEMLNRYVDSGGNLIDSARVYFDWVGTEVGRSERVIGDWLRSCKRRNEIVLITKGGHPAKDTPHTSRMQMADMEYDINLSLKSLGTDYIDIYFYHRDDTSRPVGELIEQMEQFKKEGKIRYYGCSNWSVERMKEAEDYAESKGIRGFVSSQNLYNIGAKHMNPFEDDTMVTDDVRAIDFYKNSNITPMPYFGVCSGFFHILAAEGEGAVKNSCYYTPKNLELANNINELCKKYSCTITQVLLGFFAYQECTMIPLVGTANIAQLDEALKTVNINFTKQDFINLGGI